jgi:hypothetical protein
MAVYSVEVLFAVGVVVVGKIWVLQMIKAERNRNAAQASTEASLSERKVE